MITYKAKTLEGKEVDSDSIANSNGKISFWLDIEKSKYKSWHEIDPSTLQILIKGKEYTPEQVEMLPELVTDEELKEAFGNANFGESKTRIELIKEGLDKYDRGYETGHTMKQILIDLGLIKEMRQSLTILGRKLLNQLP